MNRTLLVCLLAGTLSAQTPDFTKRLVAAANERLNHPRALRTRLCAYSISQWGRPLEHWRLHGRDCSHLPVGGHRPTETRHEDIVAHPSAYPAAHRDTNIDHRRVPNLRVFFSRNGLSLPITRNASDYLPGDVVTWSLPGGHDHIGMIVDRKSWLGHPLIEHNIGGGPKIENVSFDWKLTGHYRYR
jgi:hypothetical protein